MTSNHVTKSDLILNYMSIVLLGLSGVAMNVGIGSFYSAATLGIFNQVMSIYIIFSQLSSGGLQLSILHSIGGRAPADNPTYQSDVIVHFKMLFVLATFWSFILLVTARLWSILLGSDAVFEGCLVVVPGLFFFSFNKFFLGIINGNNQMKSYAMFQCLRYIGILLVLVLFFVFSWNGNLLPLVFTISEGLLFFIFLVYYWNILRNWSQYSIEWKDHLKFVIFGFQSMISGALLELNSRVDVLLIGIFLSDEATGIYSFAALFCEGLTQFLVVLQNMYNPKVAPLLKHKRIDEFNSIISHAAKRIYLLGLLAVPVAILAFPIGLKILNVPSEFEQSWYLFGILMTGVWIASGFYPFHTVFVMAGQPLRQTAFMMSIVVSNIVLNLLFIPLWGIYGSALGTAIAVAMSALTFQLFKKGLFSESQSKSASSSIS